MAIRVRVVEGRTIALCAVESDAKEGDLYLDDAVHYALGAKFSEDWKGRMSYGGDPLWVALMQKEKVRDAQEEIIKWVNSQSEETVVEG